MRHTLFPRASFRARCCCSLGVSSFAQLLDFHKDDKGQKITFRVFGRLYSQLLGSCIMWSYSRLLIFCQDLNVISKFFVLMEIAFGWVLDSQWYVLYFCKIYINSKTSKMTLSTDREKMTFRVFWQVVSEFRCRIWCGQVQSETIH